MSWKKTIATYFPDVWPYLVIVLTFIIPVILIL